MNAADTRFSAASPGEKAVVLETGLAVGERFAGQGLDAAAGGFENGLAGRGVPLHRRAEARVEIGLTGRDDAEFQCTPAFLALAHRIVLQKLGEADLYPRFGTTMEWDTAAGQAILEAAGGRVETLAGDPLAYGKPGFKNDGFLAWGRRA